MFYYPPSPRPISITSYNNSEGNITLSDDGYWAAQNVFIDLISVKTSSTNWSLHLCENSDFDTSSIKSHHIVSSGLGDTCVVVSMPYSSDNGNVYLVYNDLAGTDTASFHILGKTL